MAALTHAGRVRQQNEDHYFVGATHRVLQTIGTNVPEDLLPRASEEAGYGMIVADGMGGRAAGEVASRMAIIHLINLVITTPDWIMRFDDDRQADRAMQRMTERYHEVDAALKEDIKQDPSLKGMGTTMTVSYSVGADLFVGHIGDSRAYLVRGGKLQQLTLDQTLAQRLIDKHGMRREETATLKLRHILTAALGAATEANAVVRRFELIDQDQVLLCTDGLTEMVDEDAIMKVLARAASSKDACRELVDLALERGGEDNVTVALARYRFPQKA